MTEEEYVHLLRRAARDYLDQIREPSDLFAPTIERWANLRDSMSTHTFVRLCDAWLEKASEGRGGV